MSTTPEALRLADVLTRADAAATQLTNRQQAAAALRRLAAEVEALRADAERYRWLRTMADDWGVCEWDRAECEWVRDTRGAVVVDAAIDKARKA